MKYDEPNQYEHKPHYDRIDEEESDIYVMLAVGLCVILFFVGVFLLVPKKRSMGYGGSDGHMTPNEVEELYKKNHR